jgi:hypothetical protein
LGFCFYFTLYLWVLSTLFDSSIRFCEAFLRAE